MATPFSRSLRSLNADSFAPSLAGTLLAMLILLAWLGWFVTVDITLYEISETFTVTDEERILAEFPIKSQTRIRPGQAALLRLNVPMGAESVVIPAVVYSTITEPESDKFLVDVYVMSHFSPVPIQEGLTGKVEIEAEHVSPLTLVMRATGQLMDAEEVTVSPQNQEWLDIR
ncbi:hypothetical protein QUF58_06800 [Anaerolineales bacterium HSG24]|nr:hypothetical protein [Anaerolineales bacterium HSG24]